MPEFSNFKRAIDFFQAVQMIIFGAPTASAYWSPGCVTRLMTAETTAMKTIAVSSTSCIPELCQSIVIFINYWAFQKAFAKAARSSQTVRESETTVSWPRQV